LCELQQQQQTLVRFVAAAVAIRSNSFTIYAICDVVDVCDGINNEICRFRTPFDFQFGQNL